MYRWFLSWRYLVTRPTNYIGIGGITLAVGALILILSIMTGFLVETREFLRGGLSDLVVKPYTFQPDRRGNQVPWQPHETLDLIRSDERVKAATPRLVWFGLVAGTGYNAAESGRLMSDSEAQGLNGVQLVGVDVFGKQPFALFGVSTALAAFGVRWTPPLVQDEFEVTEMRGELVSDPNPLFDTGYPVEDPDHPFARPPGLRREGAQRATVVVGEALARTLGLRPNSRLKLATFTFDPDTGDLFQASRDFVVGGTFRSGENELDIGRVYMDRLELWDFLGRGPTYSEILVRLEDYESDGEQFQLDLATALQERKLVALGDLPDPTAFGQVRTWEDFRRTVLRAIENERVLLGIMLSLVLVVAAFTIFAILTMMVGEKRRDIGILGAIGASPRGVLQTFLTIGFWNATIGTSLGTLLGILGASYINEIELWLSRTFDIVIFDRNVYAFDTIPTVIQPGAVAAIVIGAFVLTLVSAAIPALRAARLNPVDALRYE